MTLYDVLLRLGATAAGGEARRLIERGAVRVDGEIEFNPDRQLDSGVYTIRIGNHRTYDIAINGRSLYLHDDNGEYTPIAPVTPSKIEWYGGEDGCEKH